MILFLISAVAACGFGVLCAHGLLTPSHPYFVGYGPHQGRLRRRLACEAGVGAIGFIASVMIAGAQVLR